jgi:hypothetical protein
MATNQKKTYRVAPSFDWPAEDGPVTLGSIITNPKEPHRPLVSDGFELPKIFTAEKNEFSKLLYQRSSFAAGVYLKILETVGVDVGGQTIRNSAELLKTKKLETKYIIPDDTYIDERVQDQLVQDWMTVNRLKVYMVTGLKIAYDPSARSAQSANAGAGAKLGADGIPSGIPLSVTGDIRYDQGRSDDISFRGGTDIIFAYELKEIKYIVVEKKMVLKKTKDYPQGVVLDRDRDQERDKQTQVIKVAESLGLEVDNGKGSRATVSDDAEGECDFVVPN